MVKIGYLRYLYISLLYRFNMRAEKNMEQDGVGQTEGRKTSSIAPQWTTMWLMTTTVRTIVVKLTHNFVFFRTFCKYLLKLADPMLPFDSDDEKEYR